MSSRLFKHQMASNNRPPIMPHMATTSGDIYGYNSKTDEFSKIQSLGILAAEYGSQVAYSHDGKFLLIARSGGNATNQYFYKRTKAGYIRQTWPAGMGSGFVASAWTPDGKYAVLVLNTTLQSLYWMRRNADDTFTVMPTPTGYVRSAMAVAVSADSKYVAISHQFSPFLTMWKIDNGVMTKLTLPAALPASYAEGLAFAGHSLVFVTGNNGGNYVYDINPVTDVVTKPVHSGIEFNYCYSCAASKDGKYVALGNIYGMDYYKYDAATYKFTRIGRFAEDISRGLGVSFSTDGQYLAVSGNATPFLKVFRRIGDTLTNLVIPAPLLPSAGGMQDIQFAEPLYV